MRRGERESSLSTGLGDRDQASGVGRSTHVSYMLPYMIADALDSSDAFHDQIFTGDCSCLVEATDLVGSSAIAPRDQV